MVTRISYLIVVAALFSQEVAGFVMQTNGSNTSPSRTTQLSATSTSLNYANAEVLDADKINSFRNSIRNTYQPEEPQVSVSKLLTEQVAREFTTGRRYLLAAAAVKELSENFYEVEEQQRVRAVELMEYARSHGIPIMDYATQVDKTPIDKSMETTALLKEMLVQEQKDFQLLEILMVQVSSKNTELFSFLETIRADQVERKDQIIQALTTLQGAHVETAASIATAHVSTTDISAKIGDNLMKKLETAEQIPSNAARWAANQLQGMGQHVHDFVSKSGHLTFTGATAATMAAVDAVDPESLPSTQDIVDAIPDDILDVIPMEDILQVVDTATTLLEEPSQLVDTIQPLSQIVDIVAGLY
jgi:ferritin